MPTRDPPFFLQEAHEVQVGDELDMDWTLVGDWGEEQRLRETRNELIEKMLKQGKTVAYRSSGWSLYPRVHSGDLCCYSPVRFEEQIAQGDIVFCKVQPSGYYYAHLIQTTEWDAASGRTQYWISNMAGRFNGHCYLEHIFGKLDLVVH